MEADVQAGFAEWIAGGLPDAKERYGDLCAAGRLGLVKKEGSQPRLIGDSSISNANQLSRICEKVELPSLADVAQFVLVTRIQSGMPSLWTLPKPTNASVFATQKEVCLFSQ